MLWRCCLPMYQKMFKCNRCGLIVEVCGFATNVNCDISLSYDSKGNIVKQYFNHDIGDIDGWRCVHCGSLVDKSNVIEVDDYEPEL